MGRRYGILEFNIFPVFLIEFYFLAVLIQFLLGLVMWWPNIVIPLWFCGGTLMYAFVILYSDSTLKSTARDIDKLKDLMYPFKKL